MDFIVAVVSGHGWHVQDLLRAARGRGLTLAPIPFQRLRAAVGTAPGGVSAEGIDLTQCRGAIVRMMPPGSLEQVVYRMDALSRLAAAGVPVLNPPRAIEAAVDKYLSIALIEAAGLRVPPTWVGESAQDAWNAFNQLGGDIVVKPLFGSEGRGLVRISDPEIARRVFHALERVHAVLYLQRFVPHDGSDMRVLVLDGRVLGAIERRARDGDWRTNVSLGGQARALELEPSLADMAIRATRAVGARLAGVDLVRDRFDGTLYVLEVNAAPGWRALARAIGCDVSSAIVAAVLEPPP